VGVSNSASCFLIEPSSSEASKQTNCFDLQIQIFENNFLCNVHLFYLIVIKQFVPLPVNKVVGKCLIL